MVTGARYRRRRRRTRLHRRFIYRRHCRRRPARSPYDVFAATAFIISERRYIIMHGLEWLWSLCPSFPLCIDAVWTAFNYFIMRLFRSFTSKRRSHTLNSFSSVIPSHVLCCELKRSFVSHSFFSLTNWQRIVNRSWLVGKIITIENQENGIFFKNFYRFQITRVPCSERFMIV